MGAVRRVQNGEWEKNRRERLNLVFCELNQLLPDHDPTLSLSKVEILSRSIAYIRELQEKQSSILDSNCSQTLKSEMTALKKRVVDLRQRNRQLADLLRAADITIPGPPPPLPLQPLAPPRKWQGRVSGPGPSSSSPGTRKEDKKLKGKPTKQIKHVKRKKKLVKNNKKLKSPPLEQNKGASNTSKQTTSTPPETISLLKTTTPLREINSELNSNTNTSIIASAFPRTVTTPCTTVSLVLSNPKTNVVSVAKSNFLSAPIMATGIQPVLDRNPTLTSLGPGTLILPDGRIVSVPPIFAPATQIIVNRPPPQPTVLFMQNVAAVNSISRSKAQSQLRTIVPKTKKDTTKTTFVNKVPIPTIRAAQAAITKVVRSRQVDKKKLVLKEGEKKVESENDVNEELNNKRIKEEIIATCQENNIVVETSKETNIENSLLKTPSMNTSQNTKSVPAIKRKPNRTSRVCDIEVKRSRDNENVGGITDKGSQITQANSESLTTKSGSMEKYTITALCTKEQSKPPTGNTLSEQGNTFNQENNMSSEEALTLKPKDAVANSSTNLEKQHNEKSSIEQTCKDMSIGKSKADTGTQSYNVSDSVSVDKGKSVLNTKNCVHVSLSLLDKQSLTQENSRNKPPQRVQVSSSTQTKPVTNPECKNRMKPNNQKNVMGTCEVNTVTNITVQKGCSSFENTTATLRISNQKSVSLITTPTQISNPNPQNVSQSSLAGNGSVGTRNNFQFSSADVTRPSENTVVTESKMQTAVVYSSTGSTSTSPKSNIQNALSHVTNKNANNKSMICSHKENTCVLSETSLQSSSARIQVQKVMISTCLENVSSVQENNDRNSLLETTRPTGYAGPKNNTQNPSTNCYEVKTCTAENNLSQNSLSGINKLSKNAGVPTNSNTQSAGEKSFSEILETRNITQNPIPAVLLTENMKNIERKLSDPRNMPVTPKNNLQDTSIAISKPSENVLTNKNFQNSTISSQTENNPSRARNNLQNSLLDTSRLTETKAINNSLKSVMTNSQTENIFADSSNNFKNSSSETSRPMKNIIANNSTNKNVLNTCEGNMFNNTDSPKKSTPTNCSKSTQVTTVQFSFPDTTEAQNDNKSAQTLSLQMNLSAAERKKVETVTKKNNLENKPIVHDVGQDLTNLFPCGDPKLQVCPDNIFRDTDFRDRNLFLPIGHSYMDEVRVSFPHSDFSNDLFSSLQVPTGGQHPESISPTAAFLLAFPLVSTSKTSEMLAENEAGESQHATPTTILQIGNIDPPNNDLFHQTSLMIENNVSDFQDALKLSKPTDSNKNTKQLKDVDHFNKFQHLEMNDLMRNENFSRNNCKEKKNNYSGSQEQSMYLPCNKKKQNERICDYPIVNEVMNHYHDKPLEFPPNIVRQNVQNPQINQSRQVTNTNNQKNAQFLPESMSDPQSFNPSQSYSFNTYPSGNDFSFPNSNYHPGNQTSKPAQSVSNFNTGNSWPSSSITGTTSGVDYAASYCTYPQKPYSNSSSSKNIPQKSHQNTFEDQRLKEKPNSTNNSLPKFSTNFQFNNNNRPPQEAHIFPNSNQTENTSYKLESKAKKQKLNPQRPPVNWMTTPDVRPILPDPNIPPVFPDVVFPPQKEFDFNSTTNNVMLGTSSNITPFSISSSVSNNPQTFYANSHISGMDFQLDFAPFPDITPTKPSKNATVTSSSQNFSWSPSKSSIPLLPHIDTHMIPSTLPTLVGDLALGTTTPSGPIDTFRNLSMPTTPFNLEIPSKKCDMKPDSQKPLNKSLEKDCIPGSERRNSNRSLPEYCQKTHSHQSTNTTSSFLSVSQLVDPVKSEQVSSRRNGKQNSNSKNNTNAQKRNAGHHSDKPNHSKSTSNINNVNNLNSYQPSMANTMVSNPRKPDATSTYHNDQVNLAYPNMFSNNMNQPPWHNPANGKPNRTTTQYKNNYSAASLIGEQPPPQNHLAELPPFSMANQYGNAQKPFTDATVSSAYSNPEFQNLQPLEFHPNQNCFNFPSHNTHYAEDYNVGLDSLYSLNPPPPKNMLVENKTSHKRNTSKRRDDFASMGNSQQMQYFPRDVNSTRGPKCPPTSSPSHHGTTSLTNFNLSTIFPEINDKRAVQGGNTFHTSGSKMAENTTTPSRPGPRPDYNPPPQMQQVGPQPPPANFPGVGQPLTNFRPQ